MTDFPTLNIIGHIWDSVVTTINKTYKKRLVFRYLKAEMSHIFEGKHIFDYMTKEKMLHVTLKQR